MSMMWPQMTAPRMGTRDLGTIFVSLVESAVALDIVSIVSAIRLSPCNMLTVKPQFRITTVPCR